MKRLVAALLLLGLLLPAGARALESAAVSSPRAVATLISDTDAVAPGQPFRVALRLRLAPGWHSYWRNPGDAGVAPTLAFALPQGVTAGEIAWPTPQRTPEGPLMTYGYAGVVLLPVTITGATGATSVGLHATWLVCNNICVPEEGDFRLDLPAGTPAPSAQAGLFAAADAAAPRPSPWPATIAADGTLGLEGAGLGGNAVRDAWFFPAATDAIAPAAPQRLALGDGSLALRLTPAAGFHADAPLAGVLVLRDGTGRDTALAITATPGAVHAPLSLWSVLGFAILGGLILNLMPCVFPVLAIKVVGLARLSGAERSHAGMHAAAYAAGVLLCFLGIAGALLGLRAAGDAVGWGFQFQSPAFVAVMAWVLLAIGLNLSGVFSVGGSFAGAGVKLVARGGHWGSFFTGLLAVLVATPCTAPFMGVAIATALAATPAVTLTVFAAMAAGFALPYVLFAAIPPLACALPRPGAWMDILKQALAFPMYAGAAWLIWVLSHEAGPEGVLAAAAGVVLVGFAAWAHGIGQSGAAPRVSRVAAVIALGGAAVLLAGLGSGPTQPAQARAEAGTESYSATRLADLRAAGKPVFVNMTAAWCVTCLVNERVALSTTAVHQAFAAAGVVYLKGDWTREDAAISAFLRSHGRDGVPLYVYFPAGGGAPVVLPQILTEGTVLQAIGAG